MKNHCHKCGGLICMAYHWQMMWVTYCKGCKRMLYGWHR